MPFIPLYPNSATSRDEADASLESTGPDLEPWNLFRGSPAASDAAPEGSGPQDSYISDYDRAHLRRVGDAYEEAKASGDPERFREALTGIGQTLQSFPHLEPHLPEGSVQAYGDFQRALDKAERNHLAATGRPGTADDRTGMAQGAAVAALRGENKTPSAMPAVDYAKSLAGPGGSRWGFAGSQTRSNRNVVPVEWYYSQGTGKLERVDESEVVTPAGQGYSGKGAGLNNPDMDHVQDTGPITRGGYSIGPQRDEVIHKGTSKQRTLKDAMRLTPDPGNDMHGRGGFLFHKDNARHDNSASEGCVVLPDNVLDRVGASQDRHLTVRR